MSKDLQTWFKSFKFELKFQVCKIKVMNVDL